MENKEAPSLLVGSSITVVPNHLGILKCFRIVVEYIFVILFIQSFAVFIFSHIENAIQPNVAADYIAPIGNLLSRFLGLVAAGYFTFLTIRKYFPQPTIRLSLSKIGLLGCSNNAALFAIFLGTVYAIIFEYFLPSRYPADPVLLENMRSQIGNGSFWRTLSSLAISVGITPIVEEIFFRGFLYKVFSGSSGKVTSAIIVTAIFVLLHYQVFSYWVALLSLLVGSITLIVIREASDSLIPPILLHQIYNLGVTIFQ